MTSSSSNRFRKDNRLLDAAAFGRVFDRAKRSRDNLFTVLCRQNDTVTASLGLAHVCEDGSIKFGSEYAWPELVSAMAQWTRANVAP